MKNYDTYLLGAYDALFKDIALWYPRSATEWRQAQVRLRSLTKDRGVRYLTVDLVSAGKHFDLCLEAGAFTPSGIAGMAIPKGQAIPRLFGGLLGRVFRRRSGMLRVDADITAISFLRQLFFTAKKVRMQCEDSATFETVKEFFDIERSVRPATLDWANDRSLSLSGNLNAIHLADGLSDRLDEDQPELKLSGGCALEANTKASSSVFPVVGNPTPLLEVIQRVADVITSGFGWFEPSEILPKHGPGAVADREGESKYDFPHWPAKLDGLFKADELAFYNSSSVLLDQEDGGPLLSKGEPPSKLISVPKTQKAPRLIASEPTAHQWIQQGILSLLVDRMDQTALKNSISLRDQVPSRELARLASIQRHLSTIDLSSASDRVSCWLVERIFRKNWRFLDAFHAARTRWLVNNLDKKLPRYRLLRKFTTMGSALTFPVQSIVYAIVCIGVDIWFRESSPQGDSFRVMKTDLSRISASQFSRLISDSSRRIRVFGDDLIVPVDTTPVVIEVLTHLGLKVNIHKTFTASFFRESCGLDAYRGVDVTPCYVNEVPDSSEPESLISVVESSNNFHNKGLWNTAAYLRDSLPAYVRNNVGVKEFGSGAFGFASFVGADVSHLQKRWNDQLHYWEAIALVPKSRNKRKSIRGSAALLQWFTEMPGAQIVWKSGVGQRTPLILKRKGIPVTSYSK